MAAGDSDIVEVYNAGKQPKQMAMASSWEKMNKDYKLALETAESVRNAAIENANKAVELAKQEKNNALRSGDKAAIKAANNAIKDTKEQSKTTKAKAKAEYNAATEQAELTKQKTHDELRSAEEAHNEEAVVNSVERGRDLADIQKEQTEKLNNVNSQSESDNQDTDNQVTSNGGKDMSKGNNKKGLGLQFSQSFYDNIGNAVRGQPTGNLADVKSKGANAQAQNLRNATATNQMEAQRAQQIANQNPYTEAGKIASVQNDAENRQNVQKAGVLGAGAALARKTNTPDVQSQMQREDQQQNVANQRREEEQANQQEATEKGNESEQWQFNSRDFTEDKDQVAALSKGELQSIMSNSRPEFMQAWNEGSGRVKDGKQINAGDEDYDKVAQTNTQDVVKNPPSDSRVKDIKKCLCDARMKWIKEDWDRDGRPSREDMIWLVNQQGPFRHNDRDYDPNDYDSWDDEDGSILGAYADNIKNYVYSYKPEATQVDPNIDPNQEHIGPMAQDIEQVNPACIKETPEGVKTVDTGRLAMMNAGVIGDLAREVQDLKARLAKLGV